MAVATGGAVRPPQSVAAEGVTFSNTLVSAESGAADRATLKAVAAGGVTVYNTLVPADSVEAYYDTLTSTLTIIAKGKVPNVTMDIDIYRLSWFGGLKFELTGWRSHGSGETPYTARKSFRFPNIFIIVPSLEIIVVTANHPTGLRVPIKILWEGKDKDIRNIDTSGNDGGDAKDKTSAGAAADDAAHVSLQALPRVEVINITTHLLETFQIWEPILGNVTRATTIDFRFNRANLSLAASGVHYGQLVWWLRASAVGTTHAHLVHTAEGTIQAVQKNYIIHVLPRRAQLAASSARLLGLGDENAADADEYDDDDDDDAGDADDELALAKVTFADSEADKDDDADADAVNTSGSLLPRLNFLRALQDAVRLVQRLLHDPRPALYIVTARPVLPQWPVRHVLELQKLHCVIAFTPEQRIPEQPYPQTALLDCYVWGAWLPPRTKRDAPFGLQRIDPTRSGMLTIFDAQRAWERKRLRGRFWSVTLSFPWVDPPRAGGAGAGASADGSGHDDVDDKAAEGGDKRHGLQDAVEPFYQFEMADRPRRIWVGAYSGSVHVTHGTPSVLLTSDSEATNRAAATEES